MKILLTVTLLLISAIFLNGCVKDDKGTGMIKEVKLKDIDPKMVSEGKELFVQKCSTCHRLDEKLIGTPLRGITNILKVIQM